MSQQRSDGGFVARVEQVSRLLQDQFQQREFEKCADSPQLVDIQRLMRLDCMHKLVKSSCREGSTNRIKVQPSHSSHAGFVATRTENKAREPGQFITLIRNVIDRRPEHAMAGSKLKQRRSPSCQIW